MKVKRFWIVMGLLLVIIVVVLFTVLGVMGRMPIYGLGGPSFTLEGYIIVTGLGLIYILLFSLPTLMVVTYQREAQVTLAGKIRDDLLLCGIDEADLKIRIRAFENRNSLVTFVGPTLFNLVFMFVMWGHVLAPNGLEGASISLTQGNSFTINNIQYWSYDSIKYY